MRMLTSFIGTGFTRITKWQGLTLFWVLGEFSSLPGTLGLPVSVSVDLIQPVTGVFPTCCFILDLALEGFLALLLLALVFCLKVGRKVPVSVHTQIKKPVCRCACNPQAHRLAGAEISSLYGTVGTVGTVGRKPKYCFKTIKFKISL